MISISEATELIERETFQLESESIDLEKSINRVLAEEIRADMDSPPFNRSQMDGFAVRVKDVEAASGKKPVKLKVIGESVAGKGFDGKINGGEAVRIMTGARVPEGADAVQKKELTREFEGEDGKRFVEIFEAAKPKQNIVGQAEEIESGTKIFDAGEIINAQMIASLASFGYAKVEVFKKPYAAILATGSEIVGLNETPKRDQIRNSNSIMLKIFAEKFGAGAEMLPIAGDEISNLKRQISNAVKTRDVLIITGGVSVGDYDFTKPALRELSAEIFFEKVSLKPGKPTVFAKLNNKLIFGLPGNPVSAAVTFYLFVRTALLKMQGAGNCELKEARAVLSRTVKGARERDSFLPARITTGENGEIIAEPIKWGGSSDFVSFANADALVFVPKNEAFEAKTIVRILYLNNW